MNIDNMPRCQSKVTIWPWSPIVNEHHELHPGMTIQCEFAMEYHGDAQHYAVVTDAAGERWAMEWD